VPPARHADASARRAPGRSSAACGAGHCFLVNDQPSPAPDRCRAGRLTSFGPTGFPAVTAPAGSAAHGHGRPGWVRRASCPPASAKTPQETPGGGFASAGKGGSLRSRFRLGVRRRREEVVGASPRGRSSMPGPPQGRQHRAAERPRSRYAIACAPSRPLAGVRPPAVALSIFYTFSRARVLSRNNTVDFPGENRYFCGLWYRHEPVNFGTITVPDGHRAGPGKQWPRECR
jgi:hypothetical protein